MTVSAGFLSVANAVDGDRVRSVLYLVATAVGVRGLWRFVRSGPRSRVAQRPDEAAAVREWPAARVRGLARDLGVGTGTSDDRIALVKGIREADPRLGLVAAKGLVDDLVD
jgi:hypothetical protein